MQFLYRLRFSGRIDRTRLTTALEAALKRHPLLTAIVRKCGRRWEWIESSSVDPSLTWMDQEPVDNLAPATYLDLRKEPGVRVTVVHGKNACDVVFQFHHSCCDGSGAGQFVNDLLVEYVNSIPSNPTKCQLDQLSPELLKQRANFGLSTWELLNMARQQLVGLQGVAQYAMRTPQPVLPHTPSLNGASRAAEFPQNRVHWLKHEEMEELRKVAMRHGVAMNDLLVRDVFLAIGDWRTQNDLGDSEDWMRLSTPLSMRTAGDVELPAANVVSMVFLDRRGADFADADKLLRSIRDEMNLIKRCRLGMTFVLTLKFLSLIPGGLRRAVRADKCAASCLVTNVGEVLANLPLPRNEGRLVVGDAILESVEITAPNRPFQCVAFLFLAYANRLGVCFQYDSRVINAELADDLLDTYIRRLRQSSNEQHATDEVNS